MSHANIVDRFFENHRRQWERRIHDSLFSAFKREKPPDPGRVSFRDLEPAAARKHARHAKAKG